MTDDVPPWARKNPSPAAGSAVDPIEADGSADTRDESMDRPLFPQPSGPAAPLFPGGVVRRPAPPVPLTTAAGGTRPPRLVTPSAAAAQAAPTTIVRAPAAPSNLSLPRSGRIVGAVTGNPTLKRERREFLGQRVLVVALIFALIMSLAFLLSAGPGALAPLLFPTAIVILLVIAYQLVLRGVAWRAAGQAAKAMFARTQRTSKSVALGASGTTGTRSANEIMARRFRLTPTAGGGFIDCVMYGEPRGPELNHGDIVIVTAHRVRDGSYRVDKIEVLRTPTGPAIDQITARPSLRFRAVRLGSRLSFVVTGLVAAWVVVVLIGLVA